ncbi:MAG: phenylalanine--tRNA ligase beta subunit-related protein [Pseudomonadota bacterium]
MQSELQGWALRWFALRPTGKGVGALGQLRRQAGSDVRVRHTAESLSQDPIVSGIRRLFRECGCDPTRYRPSSEALIRRILKGDELPVIHPLVDLNNILSVQLAVPCCVIDAATVSPPLSLRAGRAGETMQSLRGLFPLEAKPLLEDRLGPFGTPITDSERVRVTNSTTELWLVMYLPGMDLGSKADRILREFLTAAPVAELLNPNAPF